MIISLEMENLILGSTFIVSIISCSAISFCLTELLFSFDFKVSFQKALIFTILFVIFLLLFYYFIKQRTYKLFDQK
mgnify:CR=1 FL=1